VWNLVGGDPDTLGFRDVDNLKKGDDWKTELSDVTKDCPRKASPGLADPCGAQIPDLLKLASRW
jgi:hypothetical protein